MDIDISSLKIGDKINYSANGYDNWQVLYIDKENSTIDIISDDATEQLTFKGENGYNSYLDTLQSAVELYKDGKYAISARSVNVSDLDNITDGNQFYIANINGDYSIRINQRNLNMISGYNKGVGYRPIVKIKLDSTTGLNVGDKYNYSANGVDDWRVLNISSDSTIEIIPYKIIEVDMRPGEKFTQIASFSDEYIKKYVTGNAISVRLPSSSDISSLTNANIYHENDSEYTLTGTLGSKNISTNTNDGVKYEQEYYNLNCVYYARWNNKWQTNTIGYSTYKYTYGIRPVVKIRVKNSNQSRKNTSQNNLQVGDIVDYEANSYKGWKVLSIDKDNNTVDIISTGIVSNRTLEGKKDYNDAEKIFQSEADKYKNGESVISARIPNANDLDNIRNIKDVTKAQYWLTNKRKYNGTVQNSDSAQTIYNATIAYAVGVASYSEKSLSVINDWANLEVESGNKDSVLSSYKTGKYNYTAGIRPIVTLKLDQTRKKDKETTQDDSSIVNEQSKKNTSSKTNITSNDDINENDVIEDTDGNEENTLYQQSIINNNKSNNKIIKLLKTNIIIAAIILILNILIIWLLLERHNKKIRKTSK